MAWPLIALIFGQVAGSPVDTAADLATVAAASPRPRDCIQRSQGTESITPWDLARYPGTEHFCLALANGYALLSSDASQALVAAKRARQALPGRAESLVLEGRALVALGRYPEARDRFAAARQISAAALNAPAALYDFALSTYHVGRFEEALEVYRSLIPRVSLLEDGWPRQRVLIEAAALAMTRGPTGLDEAIGYLDEARRRDSPPAFEDFVLGELALALDRSGRTDEAAGVAADAAGPWLLDRLGSAKPGTTKFLQRAPLLPPGELDAVIAILAERRDPELARQHWNAFLAAQANSPFADHARRKMAQTGNGARHRK